MECLQDNETTFKNIVTVKTKLEEDYQLFYNSFIGKMEYNSSNKSIQKVEEFLIYWLNGEPIDYIEAHLETLYEQFKDVFPYHGPIYRGIELKAPEVNVEGLRDNYLTSFTDQIEVAKHFAGITEEYGNAVSKDSTSYLIQTASTDCFALDQFLLRLIEITTNIDLQIVIEERIWENEKIAYFQIQNCSISISDKTTAA